MKQEKQQDETSSIYAFSSFCARPDNVFSATQCLQHFEHGSCEAIVIDSGRRGDGDRDLGVDDKPSYMRRRKMVNVPLQRRQRPVGNGQWREVERWLG